MGCPSNRRTLGAELTGPSATYAVAGLEHQPSVELTGIHLALSVNVAVTLVSVVFIWFGLRPPGERRTAVAAVPVSKKADEELAAASN